MKVERAVVGVGSIGSVFYSLSFQFQATHPCHEPHHVEHGLAREHLVVHFEGCIMLNKRKAEEEDEKRDAASPKNTGRRTTAAR